MAILQAILLGIIEGLTEFLPISSTGHLLVAEKLLNYKDTAEIFTIVIQLGAIAAVVWYYRRDLMEKVSSLFAGQKSAKTFWAKWIIATIPAGLTGFFIEKAVGTVNNLIIIALALIAGGVAIWLIEEKVTP